VLSFGELPQTYLGPPESHHTRSPVAGGRLSASEDGR